MNTAPRHTASRWVHALLLLCAAAFVVSALGGCAGQQSQRERRLRAGTPEGLLAEAQRQVRLGSYAQAIAIYNALEIRHPFTEQNREGQLGLMYAYHQNREPESALEAADKFIRENPRHPRVDYAYYMRGLAFYPAGAGPLERLFRQDGTERPQADARRSFDNFAVFLNRFEDSQWAADARQRMIHLRNVLARYEVNVARYYMKRKGYVAAANRAKRVVTEYQGTESVNAALAIMVDAYTRLGMADLAADAQRVLEENRRTPAPAPAQ